MAKTSKKGKTAIILLLIIAVFCFAGFLWSKFLWFDKSLDGQITTYGAEYGVSRDLIYAVIKAESNFNAAAVSNKGARGLMQLMPATAAFVAEKLGESSFDIDDPKQNIRFGVYYLSYLQKRFDGESVVLAAYNAGENTVGRWLEDDSLSPNGRLEHIPYAETKKYVDKIAFFKKAYNVLYK